MNYIPALYGKLLAIFKDPVTARIVTALITGSILLFSFIMGISIFRGCSLNGIIK